MPSGGSRSQKAASSESEGEESSRISTHDEGSDTNYDDDDGYDYDSGSSSSGGSETECPTCEKERRKESKASKRPLEKVDEVKGVDPGDLAPGTFLEDYMNEGQPQQAPASATGASQQQQQPTANKKAKASSDEDSVSAIVKLAVQQYQQQQLQQQLQQQQQQQQPAEKKTKKPVASRLPAVGHKESGAFALAPAVFAPPAKTAREQKQQQRVLARRLGNLGKQLQSALSEYQDLSRELNPPGQQ
jgi:hypothetical protein